MNAVCNNCRKTETPETLPPETSTPAVLTSATKLTQESDKSARRKPSPPSGKSQVSVRTGPVLRTKSATPRSFATPYANTRSGVRSGRSAATSPLSAPTRRRSSETVAYRAAIPLPGGSLTSRYLLRWYSQSRESSQRSLNASVERVTDSQAPALLTSVSADESFAQDIMNTQKTRAKDAPLGDTSYLGVSNILIPVSTMEFFFQRFDMLQDQLDGLRALVSRGSVPRGISSSLAEGGATVGTEELNTRISALETQLANNISTSNRLLDSNKLLLDENSILRDELQQTQQLLGRIHRARQDHDTGSMTVSGKGPMVASSPSIIIDREATEVAGARKCSSPQLAPTGGGAGSERGGTEGPVRAQRNDMTATKSATHRGVLPSLVVRLASPGLVREVMRAKSALANNYLTTNDIKPGVLDPEAAACLSGQKVCINEMLSQEKLSQFKNLRPIAQGLGFKYVWHVGGRFLARRTEGCCNCCRFAGHSYGVSGRLESASTTEDTDDSH
ncbi:hypothetical protein TSAR_001633 [Trichomalopsis sarcophagae]|uniref:Uncharacterized protein n=1 Tax=Trichomalopsis sarcophagae TaxID=543379 RepID=A0A232EI60_9HYME|nr:hypothetical protein TSAR_001633 [Trichomalopsis sarcophagae]